MTFIEEVNIHPMGESFRRYAKSTKSLIYRAKREYQSV